MNCMLDRRISMAGLTLLMTIAGAAAARAQSVHDSLGWHLTGNLGYVRTSGNTELSTINLSDKLTFRPNRTWLFTQQAAFIHGENDSVETANQFIGSLRADYYLRANLSLFALAGYERNPFAGLDRRYEEQLGLSWMAIKKPKGEVQVDLGAGANQQTTLGVEDNFVSARLAPAPRSTCTSPFGLSWMAITKPKGDVQIELGAGANQQTTLGVQDEFLSARLAPRLRYNLTDKAYLEESIELVENLDNTGDLRSMSLTQLVAPITAGIGIRLSYLARYDAEPVPGFKKLDTTFTSGLQFSF